MGGGLRWTWRGGLPRDRRTGAPRPGPRRRRQFGCRSMVPGRFRSCSASPSRSSSGASMSGAGGRRRPVRHRQPARRIVKSGARPSAVHRRKRLPKTTPVALTPFGLPLGWAGPRPDLDIAAAPPAGYGRQIVRRRHGNGIGPPAGGRPEAAAVALEPHHVHAGDTRLGEPTAEAASTVPRSSPITTAPWRCDSSARRCRKSSRGIVEIGALRGRCPLGTSQRR